MKYFLLIGLLFLGGMLPYTTTATANTLNDAEKLMEAMEDNDIEAVKLLIEAGVDVNAKSEKGYTALMAASWVGYKEIAELLIGAGANVNVTASDGRTALMLASWKSPQGFFARILQGLGATVNADDKLAYQERQKGIIVELLIAAGAEVNARENEEGVTALMVASSSGHKEIVGILIRAGADVNLTTSDGEYTALKVASKKGHEEIAALLIAAGAK